MKNFSVIAILVLALPLMGFVRPNAAQKQKTLRVAVVLRFEDIFRSSIHAAFSGINAAKLVFEKSHPGITIDLKHYTHKRDLQSILTASQRVVSDGYAAAIGGELSEEAYTIGQVFDGKSIVLISPTSTSPRVIDHRPFVFLGSASDQSVARQVARFIVENLKPKKLGIMRNVSILYSDYLAKAVKENLILMNKDSSSKVEIVDADYIQDVPDFSRVIDQFMKEKVTHVFIPSHQDDFVKFVIEASQKGFYPIYMGSDGLVSNSAFFEDLANLFPEKNKFLAYKYSFWQEEVVTPMGRSFQQVYRDSQKVEPTPWSANAFDSALILFTAMSQAEDPNNGESIRKQMLSMKNLPLATSRSFSFDGNNYPSRELQIYRIDKDGIKFEKSVR